MRWLRYLGGIALGSSGLYILTVYGHNLYLVFKVYNLRVEWDEYLGLVCFGIVGLACIWQACRLFRKPKRKVRRVSHENN